MTFRGRTVIESNTCLLPMVTRESDALIRLFGHYKNHFLPRAGGLDDQTPLYVSAMELLRQVFAEIERDALDRARKRTAKQAQ